MQYNKVNNNRKGREEKGEDSKGRKSASAVVAEAVPDEPSTAEGLSVLFRESMMRKEDMKRKTAAVNGRCLKPQN